MANNSNDNGIYYFLGNITSHILHALPLHQELGGTFVVLSKKAQQELEKYNVPVIALDDKPHIWKRFGLRFKRVREYLLIDRSLKKTTDFLNERARVVLFYELYDFAEPVRLSRPKTVFLTHGNMIKSYMSMHPRRLELVNSYDYVASVGPHLKQQFIRDGVDPSKLVDLGIARTDGVVMRKGHVRISPYLKNRLRLDTNKRIIAYMPTFWGASTIYNVGKEIIRYFPMDYTLIFRPHPQTPDRLLKDYQSLITKRFGNVIYAPPDLYPDISLTDIYAASSVIIGDVSSIMLEAILTKKPLIFAYDSGKNRQSETDYEAIRAVVDYSQYIDSKNVHKTPEIIAKSLKNGIENNIWEDTAKRTFFHHDGSSVSAISKFVTSINKS
jgi:CDP-glycerol glycerophosphotransferase (TagB/SpsB family)